MPVAKAEGMLDAAGLGMVVDRLELSSKPAGTVLDQAPRPGTSVPVASTVAVVVATSKAIK